MGYITLSREAFFHNLGIIAAKTGDKSKIALVLKDNAYGHGLDEMAALAQEYGIRHAIVRRESEALRIAGRFESILMLDDRPSQPQLHFTYTLNALEAISNFPSGTQVELKVDTGMHRNGIAADELEQAFDMMLKQGLTCKGVFTHHRGGDALGSEFFWQRKNFERVKEAAKALGFEGRFHACNSAALFRNNSFDDDIARVGIAAYGCLAMPKVFGESGLKPVMALWASRQATRELHVSECVGYNATFEAKEALHVSTYDVGYGDGLLRAASNRYTTPNGSQLLGRISMDNISVTCKDEELLIFNDANDYAAAAGTIGYEVLVRMSPALERRVI